MLYSGKKKEVEVEEEIDIDPEVLKNFCVGLNYFKSGEEIPLKPDNEYPDWIWTHLDSVENYDVIPTGLEKAVRRKERKRNLIEKNEIRKELRR